MEITTYSNLLIWIAYMIFMPYWIRITAGIQIRFAKALGILFRLGLNFGLGYD